MSLTINHQTNDISASSGSMTIDGAAVGAETLLSTTTVSGLPTSVTVGSSTIFSSTYKLYRIRATNLCYSIDLGYSQLRCVSGGSVDTGNNYYLDRRLYVNGTAPALSGQSTTSIWYDADINAANSDNYSFHNVNILLYDPASTKLNKRMFIESNHVNAAHNLAGSRSLAEYRPSSQAAVTGIQFFSHVATAQFKSFNSMDPTIKIYGIS